MTSDPDTDPLNPSFRSWALSEVEDGFDEEMEIEIDDDLIRSVLNRSPLRRRPRCVRPLAAHSRLQDYFRVDRLQSELIKLQDWVVETKYKLVVIFEGRDAAGKGSRSSGSPSGSTPGLPDRGFARAVRPGEIPMVLSALCPASAGGGGNGSVRPLLVQPAGVERVMGFASEEEVEQFFEDVPAFERMLAHSGIKLIKYWFSITMKSSSCASRCAFMTR